MSILKSIPFWAIIVTMVGLGTVGTTQEITNSQRAPKVSKLKIGEVKNVHRSGNLIVSGQFTLGDLQSMKQMGIERVISLRNANETQFDESESVTNAGLEFLRVPFATEETLTDDVFDNIRKLLRADARKTLLHCGSANRVGGVWLTYRVLDQGVDVDTAITEAKKIGLRTPFIQEKALDYIQRQKLTKPKMPVAKQRGNADVTFVKAKKTSDLKWTFEVTVDHPDVGWKDFANGWDVVLPDGQTILLSPSDKFTRELAHPHVGQQPFTRAQSQIPIPAAVSTVTVRAHDLVDGYGGKTIQVNLNEAQGKGFKVIR